jgi:hypothetical protein
MMPAQFNLYTAWMDPYFYVWAAVFSAALFAMVYSIRRYLQLGSMVPLEQEPASLENPFLEEPAPVPAAEEDKTLVLEPSAQPFQADDTPDGEKTLVVPPPFAASEELPAQQQEFPLQQEEPVAEAPEEIPAVQAEPAGPAPAPSPDVHGDHARAENFVRGIYAGITDLDERMKSIEEALSKSHVNSDFAVKFLEDMIQDMDNLDKTKIKARIEYLLSDLKK